MTSCEKTDSNATTDTTLIDAYSLAVNEGFEGTQEEWLKSLTCGKSVYEIAVENGYAGTEADWLATLQGKDGVDGKNGTSGVDGLNGTNGEDATDIAQLYQMAKDEDNYTGSFLDFVKSLNLELNAGQAIEYVANQAVRSVVSINTYYTEVAGYNWQTGAQVTTETAYAGSGIIYKLDKENGDAYIITNYHVIYSSASVQEDHICTDIRLKVYGKEYSEYEIKSDEDTVENGTKVEYIGGAMNYDIAVIKVSNSELLKTAPVIAATINTSPYTNIGSTAVVVGNPNGDGLSNTSGVISVDSEYIDMTGVDNSTSVSFRVLRVDAPINGGNSGGGLFNDDGELIGIVNAKCVKTGIDNVGYALPTHTAVNVADNVIANFESGNTDLTLKRLLIGISVERTNSYAEYDEETQTMNIKEELKVKEVVEGSAVDGKLLVGDKLISLQINGSIYALDREYILREKLIGAKVGDTIQIIILRDGVEVPIDITFQESNLQLVP